MAHLHGIEFLLLSVMFFGISDSRYNCSFANLMNYLNLSHSLDFNTRPVRDWKKPSTVLLDLTLYSLVSVDTHQQSVNSFFWFTMRWQNEFVSWNPGDFCGMSAVTMSDNVLWKPDLFIYEMTEDSSKNPDIPFLLLSHTGNIENSKPLRIISVCNFDIHLFPFDTQVCNLTFGPFLHPAHEIILNSVYNSSEVTSMSKEVFLQKGDWNLVDIKVHNKTSYFDGDHWSKVIYEITIKRTPIVYVINLVIPACLMVILDVASMFIPIRSEERLGFKITVIFGFSVLLLILNDILPNSNSTPLLGIFCCMCLGVMVFGVIGTIVASRMIHMSSIESKMSPRIKTLMLVHIAPILGLKSILREKQSIPEVSVCPDEIEIDEVESQKDDIVTPEMMLLKQMLEDIHKIQNDLTLSRSDADAMSEWDIASLVVDRLVLCFYLLTVVILFVTVVLVWAI